MKLTQGLAIDMSNHLHLWPAVKTVLREQGFSRHLYCDKYINNESYIGIDAGGDLVPWLEQQSYLCTGRVSATRFLANNGVPLGEHNTQEEDNKVNVFQRALLEAIESPETSYNGHSQLTLESLSLTSCLEITKALEERYEMCSLTLQYNGDQIGGWGGSVYAIDFWKTGEHTLGHTDKLLFGINKITGV